MSAVAALAPGLFCGLWNGAYHKETLERLKAVPQWQMAPHAAAEKARDLILERINAIPDEAYRRAELRQTAKVDTLAQCLGFYMTCATLKKVPGRKRWGAPIFNVEISVREMAGLIEPGRATIAWCLRWLRTGEVRAEDGTVLGEGIAWLRSATRGGVAVINGEKKAVRRTSVRRLSAQGFYELGLASRFASHFQALLLEMQELGECFKGAQAELDELSKTDEQSEADAEKAKDDALRANPEHAWMWEIADRQVAEARRAELQEDTDSS